MFYLLSINLSINVLINSKVNFMLPYFGKYLQPEAHDIEA